LALATKTKEGEGGMEREGEGEVKKPNALKPRGITLTCHAAAGGGTLRQKSIKAYGEFNQEG